MFLQVPRIRRDSSEYSVTVGEAVTVRAEVWNMVQERLTVTWMFDGKDVSSDPDINIKTKGREHEMTITKAALRHSGTYTIKAVNRHGFTDSEDIRVTVCCKYNIF